MTKRNQLYFSPPFLRSWNQMNIRNIFSGPSLTRSSFEFEEKIVKGVWEKVRIYCGIGKKRENRKKNAYYRFRNTAISLKSDGVGCEFEGTFWWGVLAIVY